MAIGVKECTGIRGCSLMCSHDRPSAYLPFAPEQIVEAELRLSADTERLRQTISEVVWNGGQNRIIDRVDEWHTLLTIEMCIEEDVPVRHTIRLLRNSDESGLLEHEINVE